MLSVDLRGAWVRGSFVWSAMLLVTLLADPVGADDATIAALLKARGADVSMTKGMATALTLSDGSKLSEDDFGQLLRLNHLKTVSLSNGLDEGRIARLPALADLELLQTNLAQLSDDGVKPLAGLKNLRNLKFFHPGKAFSGAGLVHLAGLPHLERLTVAGSLAFNDEGMAAVAKLTGLKEFRTWHAGGTNEGVRKLQALKNLKSLTLGQRLTYKSPACPNDETIALLAEMSSLESLQLEEARLSYPALQHLKRLPALKKLTLAGIDISRDEVERLRGDLPRAKIEWSEPNEVYRKRIRALFGSR